MPSLVRRAALLGLTALVLYGVAPAIGEVLGAWPKVANLKPWWLAGMVLTEVLSSWFLWELQALSIGTRDMTAVATSQLAGGALGRVIPGGAATAAATQYNMLNAADVPRAAIATGLAAATVLQIAALCVLPVLALPAVIFGLTVPSTLLETAILALVVFFAMLGIGLGVARSEKTLRGVGRFAVRVSRRLPGERTLSPEFPGRLVTQRNEVFERLGDRVVWACAAAVGRWLFDLLALEFAIQAVGASPRYSLVLLAYVTAQLLAQIPLTPGGLGVVEAGLTATLALAGVSGGDAAVAVLAYRLVSYWLMLPAGLVAWIVHRRRLTVSPTT
ncbi:MAG TPA: YbhN family protein [Baekduia sp.]|uniref:lysylphosphatidylglycerol synthase transmembrane domain-containing protein n=1 Tax=Baekduia sp. TaxID=2600305 RepID=UPI002D78090B|nr:YbhN family protein [Baekduia sp.]HET6506408.1 YbhN family protein [Baekduia sp.]